MAAVLLVSSCKKDNEKATEHVTPPKAEQFAQLRDSAMKKRTQHFRVTVDSDISFTSDKGVTVRLYQNALKINGEPVTGDIDVEFIEIFDSGDMLATNKRTMGRNDDGDLLMLISGGAFYINAKQNGVALDPETPVNVVVPGELTGGADTDMLLWDGEIEEDGDLVWEVAKDGEGNNRNKVGVEGTNYYATFAQFGWTNIDKFYNDPREKTVLWVKAPEGFDNKNSAIYLKYKGEPNALASLDVYDTDQKMFSEHYGQIPVGIECHLIFASESDDNWRVAVKSVTIEKDKIYTFNISETTVKSESAMVSMINALP